MDRSYTLSTPLAGFIAILSASTIYACLVANFLSEKTTFLFLTLILIAFLIREIQYVRYKHNIRWLLNPAVLCSITTFGIYFGLTNVLYFLPDYVINVVGLSSNVTFSMNKLMLLVIIGAVAMWLGYWSPYSNRILRTNFITNLQHKYFDNDNKTYIWVIPTLYLVANICRLLEVWLGIYGYSSNYYRMLETSSYAQFLIIGDNIGMVALIITALQYQYDKSSITNKIYFIIILAGEIIWGILSGMKSGVMIPFIGIFLVQYLRQGKVLKSWLILAPIIVVIAYSIVDPFREERNNNPNFEATSVKGITKAIIMARIRKLSTPDTDSKAEQSHIIKQEQDAEILVKVLSRINLTYVGSVGISVFDKNGLPPGSPEFALNTLKAPFAAFIPRFIWHNKPIQDIGVWYTQAIMGQSNSFSSTAMSIFTNLYFIGGATGVFIGLYIIGIIQRLIFFTSKPWASSAGATIYLAFMTKFEVIAEADTQTIIVFTLRTIPLLLILQSLIYKKTFKVEHNGQK